MNEGTPAAGPHLSVETKFMQNYRVAVALDSLGS